MWSGTLPEWDEAVTDVGGLDAEEGRGGPLEAAAVAVEPHVQVLAQRQIDLHLALESGALDDIELQKDTAESDQDKS